MSGAEGGVGAADVAFHQHRGGDGGAELKFKGVCKDGKNMFMFIFESNESLPGRHGSIF